jgi:glutamine amidotransferase
VWRGEFSDEMLLASGLDTLIPTLTQPVGNLFRNADVQQNRRGNTKGLGILTDVLKFSNKVKVPQMGWNTNNLKSDLFKDIQRMNTCI